MDEIKNENQLNEKVDSANIEYTKEKTKRELDLIDYKLLYFISSYLLLWAGLWKLFMLFVL